MKFILTLADWSVSGSSFDTNQYRLMMVWSQMVRDVVDVRLKEYIEQDAY